MQKLANYRPSIQTASCVQDYRCADPSCEAQADPLRPSAYRLNNKTSTAIVQSHIFLYSYYTFIKSMIGNPQKCGALATAQSSANPPLWVPYYLQAQTSTIVSNSLKIGLDLAKFARHKFKTAKTKDSPKGFSSCRLTWE